MGASTIGGNPSEAWINGSLDLKVLSHEMGHNFGLYHSHALDCGTAVLGTNCSVFEYGDRMDTMGNTSAGHFNAFQRERLGWLDYGISSAITTVQANGCKSRHSMARYFWRLMSSSCRRRQSDNPQACL